MASQKARQAYVPSIVWLVSVQDHNYVSQIFPGHKIILINILVPIRLLNAQVVNTKEMVPTCSQQHIKL